MCCIFVRFRVTTSQKLMNSCDFVIVGASSMSTFCIIIIVKVKLSKKLFEEIPPIAYVLEVWNL